MQSPRQTAGETLAGFPSKPSQCRGHWSYSFLKFRFTGSTKLDGIDQARKTETKLRRADGANEKIIPKQ